MRPVVLLSAAILIGLPALIFAEDAKPRPPRYILDDAPPEYTRQFRPRHAPPYPAHKPAGAAAATDWAALIDATWGPGLPWSQQVDVWTDFWNQTNDIFACFPGLDYALWDSVWNDYDPEVQDTVSRGRLAAMVSHASRALRESHTNTEDTYVSFSQLGPGVPLMWIGAYGINDHFGAGLTVLDDTALLVYQTVSSHPLGLEPGDLVLGYDGELWRDVYPQLIDAQLPLTGYWWGSSDYSHDYCFRVAAGMNWHLFDSIDVVKYASGDTLRLSTQPLATANMTLWATEQMDIPGVPKPDLRQGEVISWGVIEGSRIGYIYSGGWFPSSQGAIINNRWRNALDSLQDVHNVSGVIMDFRTNYGANFSFAPVLGQIFDSSFLPSYADIRCGDRFDLCRHTGIDYLFNINSTGDGWDKPIAILTGPGAVSGGDFYPMILSMHPLAKVFGRPSSSAFNAVSNYGLPNGDFSQRISVLSAYLVSNQGQYITRAEWPNVTNFPWVDYQEVWLTQAGVASGVDDVVETARAWIESRDYDGDGIVNEADACPALATPENSPILTGDADQSGEIQSADVIYLVNYIFKGGFTPLPLEASGDVDCSGAVTSADIVELVEFVFRSGPEPCDVCAIL